MSQKHINISLPIPTLLGQELAIEAKKNNTNLSNEIINRLEKTFAVEALEKELHTELQILKNNEAGNINRFNISSHDAAVQNEELRIIMTKMERLQKDLLAIKNIVASKIR